MTSVHTKVNVDALLLQQTANGKSVGAVLKELNYPTESLKDMYSFQQVLELQAIKELLESQGLEMPTVLYQ